MGRLIDGDGFKVILQAKAEALRTGCPDNHYGLFLAKVCKMVDLMPTVDAEPVKHGHWEMKEVRVRTPFGRNAICSECGFEPIELGRYCINCGAKMDEEEANEVH